MQAALLEADDQALGRSRGGLTTKLHLLVEGRGRPLALVLSAGQRHDSQMLGPVLEAVYVPRAGKGRARKRPTSLLADKAYCGKPCRRLLRQRGIACMIPTPHPHCAARKRKGRKGGRPYKFEQERYRMRNLVERCINRLKQVRRVATRYEKRADCYLAVVTFAGILLWLRS